jgi:transmembrane sensor
MSDRPDPDAPRHGRIDFALLDRFLAGECSPEEAERVRRWLASGGGDAPWVDAVRDALERRAAVTEPDTDAAWARIARDTADPERNAERLRPSLRLTAAAAAERGAVRRLLASPWRRAAAAVTLAAGAGGLWAAWNAAAPPAPTARVPAPMREYATPRGQRATFQLSDGTRLVLAAESRLRVPADYGRGAREVYLEGEALFEVVHDSTRPFRVFAKDAVAEDLGTRFDVRAYPEDSAVAVAVADGAVALGRADTVPGADRPAGEAQGVVLREGELGTLASNGRVTTATGSIVATYLAWAEGRLQFMNAPLPEVARVVGRWYDLDVRIDGPTLASRTVTAEFAAQSADDLLRALALAVDARVTRSGKIVTLRSGF